MATYATGVPRGVSKCVTCVGVCDPTYDDSANTGVCAIVSDENRGLG